MLVAVSGTIGVGKSTLCARLAGETGFSLIPEPVGSNPYLGDFYKDPSRWAFTAQIFMITDRFRRQRHLGRQEGYLLDRCLHEDWVFAQVLHEMGHLSDREWATYLGLYESLIQVAPVPDAVVYLRVTPETALRRIGSRGRDSESAISLSYLSHLHRVYEEWAETMAATTTVVTLDWGSYGDASGIVERLFPTVKREAPQDLMLP